MDLDELIEALEQMRDEHGGDMKVYTDQYPVTKVSYQPESDVYFEAINLE